MLSIPRRLASLTFVEQVLLLQLAILSLGLRALLATVALPRLLSCLSCMASAPLLDRIPLFHARYSADRLFTLIDLATAGRSLEGRCLPRSVLLFWLLSARRESVELCLGVTKHTTSLNGHAWVELRGIVVGDPLSFTRRYTPVLRLSA